MTTPKTWEIEDLEDIYREACGHTMGDVLRDDEFESCYEELRGVLNAASFQEALNVLADNWGDEGDNLEMIAKLRRAAKVSELPPHEPLVIPMMVDLKEGHVEVQYDLLKGTVWINVDGIRLFRMYEAKSITTVTLHSQGEDGTKTVYGSV